MWYHLKEQFQIETCADDYLLAMLHIESITVCFCILALAYLGIIPFMKTFMPHVTAQK